MPKNPNILMVGKRNLFNWPENLAEAFREIGCRTDLFFINRRKMEFRLFRNIARELGIAQSDHFFDRALAIDLQKTILKNKPDMILFVSPFFMPATLFSMLTDIPSSIRKIGWIGDLFGPEMKKRADQLERLYCSDSAFVEHAFNYEFKSEASLLPHAFNPRIFNTIGAGPRTNGLLFVGAYSKPRAEIFEQLTEAPCRIIGPKWNQLQAPRLNIEARQIALRKVAKLYKQSQAVLNIQSFDNVVAGLNMRTFEAAACGSAVLNDGLKDLPLCFEPEKEIFVYRTPEELNEQAKRIIRNPQKTMAVAAAGCRRVNQEHTYRHRAEKILQELR